MARIAISFLGRGPTKQYNYVFSDGDKRDGHRFFLPALLEHLDKRGASVDRVLVVGAETSHWYQLAETLVPEYPGRADALSAFHRAERKGLSGDDLAPAWQKLFPGNDEKETRDGTTQYRAAVVDVSHGNGQSVELATLEAMQQVIGPSDKVVLDLTQGMRHQPLVGMLAALYYDRLPRNRAVEIELICSASVQYDRNDNERDPVVVRDLRQVLDLAAWIFALGAFEASGDTGVFTELLKLDDNDGEAVKLLRDGAALERATRTGRAAQKFAAARARLNPNRAKIVPLAGAGKPFAEDFHEALDWIEGNAFEQQRKLAERHLKHKDWLRAATHMFEACRTRLVEAAKRDPAHRVLNPTTYKDRQKAQSKYLDCKCGWFHERLNTDERGFRRRKAGFRTLKEIRNVLAHAGGAERRAAKIVEQPFRLEKALNGLAKRLFADRKDGSPAFP